jgi:hypothetical protein
MYTPEAATQNIKTVARAGPCAVLLKSWPEKICPAKHAAFLTH